MKSIDDATPEEWNALNKKKPWVKPLIDQEDQHNNYPKPLMPIKCQIRPCHNFLVVA